MRGVKIEISSTVKFLETLNDRNPDFYDSGTVLWGSFKDGMKVRRERYTF